MRARLRWAAPALLLVVALGLAACGEDEDEGEAELDDEPEMEEPEEEPEPDEPEDEPEPDEPEDVTYVIQEGDTLSAIAADFDVAVDDIIDANDIDDPDAILVGDELVIPDVDPEDRDADEDDAEDAD